MIHSARTVMADEVLEGLAIVRGDLDRTAGGDAGPVTFDIVPLERGPWASVPTPFWVTVSASSAAEAL